MEEIASIPLEGNSDYFELFRKATNITNLKTWGELHGLKAGTILGQVLPECLDYKWVMFLERLIGFKDERGRRLGQEWMTVSHLAGNNRIGVGYNPKKIVMFQQDMKSAEEKYGTPLSDGKYRWDSNYKTTWSEPSEDFLKRTLEITPPSYRSIFQA